MPSAIAVSTPPQSAPKRQRTLANDNAYLQNASFSALLRQIDGPSASGVKLPSYLTKSQSDISHLFHDLEWKQRIRLSHAMNNRESPYRVDRSQVVIDRNRYSNVQPWDASRIKLKSPIGGSDYVNASPIHLRSRTTAVENTSETTAAPDPAAAPASPETSDTKYIATQGPKDGQFSHFWHMVMQETVGDVGVIVMLTQLYEGNKEKCAQYFPKNMDNPVIPLSAHEDSDENVDDAPRDGDPFLDTAHADAGADSRLTEPTPENGNPTASPSVQDETQTSSSTKEPDSITLLSLDHDHFTGCELRKLRLSLNGHSKVIYHYLFTGWPDYGRPEAADRAALRNLIHESARVAGSRHNPRFIHCSAGVGRTGTFIALDYLLNELDSGLLQPARVNENENENEIETENEDAVQENGHASADSTVTWGTSGPVKERKATPEPDEDSDDVIYDTVDKLREQRMMMVMSELQFAFLYEVLREAWLERCGNKNTATMTGTGTGKAPSGMGVITGSGSGSGSHPSGEKGRKTLYQHEDDEDEDEQHVSEAETEIVDVDEENAKDPYDAVAPQSIRRWQDGRL